MKSGIENSELLNLISIQRANAKRRSFQAAFRRVGAVSIAVALVAALGAVIVSALW